MPQSAKNKDREIPPHYTRLEGSEHRPAPHAKFLEPADPGEHVKVTVALRRRPNGARLPDFDHFAKTSPHERPRLPAEEFAEKYGAAPEDIERVVEFARRSGLTVAGTHTGRRTVVVAGTVAQMETAFLVSLGRYEHAVFTRRGERPRTEIYRGLNGFIHVPRELADVIIAVIGLDNRRITKRATADPVPTTTLTVQQVTGLYHFPTNSAAGQTIAIFSEGGYANSDLLLFFGASMPTIIPVPVDSVNLGADPETTQDICIAGAAAPGAAVAVYFTTYDQLGWFDLIHRVVHPDPGDPICFVLSASFYVSNGDDLPTLLAEGVSVSWVNAVHAALFDAALQNVTFCTVSGDYGVDTTSYGGAPSDGKAHVVYPASDPLALGCGGTTVGNVNGSSFEEYVWNDTFFGGQTGATGGGVSNFFPLPGYQLNASVPVSLNGGLPGRGVPDIAANASPNSGYPLTVGGFPTVGNGTSAAAPLYAGLIAIINASLGTPVGFVNPTLYALGEAICRDIDPLATNPPSGPLTNGLNTVAGYPAGPDWDACTGWGVIDGRRLLAALNHEPLIATAIADSGSFANTCVGSFTDELLTINNTGFGLLNISNILSSSADFKAPGVISYPLIVNPGDSLDVVVRFQPASFGAKAANISIISNDPAGPHIIPVSGVAQAPRLVLAIAGNGSFGKVCVGSLRDEPLILSNSGKCTLTVTGIGSSSGEFLAPHVLNYPVTIGPGDSLPAPIRFEPTSFGPKAAMLTITSDDPAGPKTIGVSGIAPSGTIAVTGSTCFGGVKACCCAERTISICNVGDCNLHVAGVAFKRKSRHWKLIANPFPAALHPGSCLCVIIRYKATEKCPRACELVITSDDPITPVKTLDLMAYTIWSDCGCKRCCEDCRKGCCEKRHKESCCEDRGEDCCDDDEEDDNED